MNGLDNVLTGPTRAMRLASAQVDRARREYQAWPSFARYKAFAAALERQTAVMRQADAARRLAQSVKDERRDDEDPERWDGLS
jgi:hypothetical protein